MSSFSDIYVVFMLSYSNLYLLSLGEESGSSFIVFLHSSFQLDFQVSLTSHIEFNNSDICNDVYMWQLFYGCYKVFLDHVIL